MQNTEISGQVTDVIFKNEDNGYAVVRIENDTDEFIAVGTLFGINEGENVTRHTESSLRLRCMKNECRQLPKKSKGICHPV